METEESSYGDGFLLPLRTRGNIQAKFALRYTHISNILTRFNGLQVSLQDPSDEENGLCSIQALHGTK